MGSIVPAPPPLDLDVGRYLDGGRELGARVEFLDGDLVSRYNLILALPGASMVPRLLESGLASESAARLSLEALRVLVGS